MDFFRACLKKIRACPFSKATAKGLVHEKCFLGALPCEMGAKRPQTPFDVIDNIINK